MKTKIPRIEMIQSSIAILCLTLTTLIPGSLQAANRSNQTATEEQDTQAREQKTDTDRREQKRKRTERNRKAHEDRRQATPAKDVADAEDADDQNDIQQNGVRLATFRERIETSA